MRSDRVHGLIARPALSKKTSTTEEPDGQLERKNVRGGGRRKDAMKQTTSHRELINYLETISCMERPWLILRYVRVFR